MEDKSKLNPAVPKKEQHPKKALTVIQAKERDIF